MPCHLRHRCPFLSGEELGDVLFPRICLVTGILLGLNVLGLECRVRPPTGPLPVQRHRLSEQLVTVARKRGSVNRPALDRPEAPATGFITQICRLVRGADKDSLTVFDHFLAPIARPVPLHCPRDECLQCRGFGPVEG